MAEAGRVVKKLPLNTGAVRAVIAAIAALLAYGAWAFWVNSQYSTTAGWRAGLVQGVYAFVLTLCSSLLYEFLFSRMRDWHLRKFKCLAAGMTLQFVTAYGIHWQVGTPAILVTILPGLAIGSVYATFYLLLLEKLESRCEG